MAWVYNILLGLFRERVRVAVQESLSIALNDRLSSLSVSGRKCVLLGINSDLQTVLISVLGDGKHVPKRRPLVNGVFRGMVVCGGHTTTGNA